MSVVGVVEAERGESRGMGAETHRETKRSARMGRRTCGTAKPTTCQPSAAKDLTWLHTWRVAFHVPPPAALGSVVPHGPHHSQYCFLFSFVFPTPWNLVLQQ